MYPIDNLLSDLEVNTQELITQILGFDAVYFDQKPSEQSWSAAELAEHIYVLDRVTYNLLRGETTASDRPADEKKAMIQSAMNDQHKTYAAPDPIVPLGKIKDQQTLVSKITTVRKDISTFVQTADLSTICLGFIHKGFGPMTRLEWVIFLIAHTQRHLKQFQHIAQHITTH